MDDFELELKHDFLNESVDLLEAAESAFLRLEDERENSDLLNEIFRLAHNLKGTSKAVGFDQLAELTHSAENLILMLKEGTLTASDSIVSSLLEFKDEVNRMVEGLKENIEASFEIQELKNKLEAMAQGQEEAFSEAFSPTEEAQEEPISPVEEVESDALLEESTLVSETLAMSTDEAFEDLELSEMAIEEPSPVISSSAPPPPPSNSSGSKNSSSPPKSTENEESIRVKLSRIDKINNVVGELVILQTVISQRRYEFIQDDISNKSIGMMEKLFKEVQEIAMSLRMLPMKPTFQKMTRIVRDTSKLLGKEIQLHLYGEETEVDKTVLEKISDPLVHIVRNSVDHGLETTEGRLQAGKDKKGQVYLKAFHEGSNLVIEVKDDGKGIDPNIIRKKAIEKKIISESSNMSDHDVIHLIFHPGFSTKEQVTEVSGRGVGMDVVRTNIESLGGEIRLNSVVGQGTTIQIYLPLTLAIIEGIVIRSEEDKFVLPLSQVYEISQVKAHEIENFSGVAKLFKLRGEVLPLFFINKKLGKKVPETSSFTVIVVRGSHFAYGVVVDDIINQQQIVIKKLGEDIRDQNGIIGSAIMSDGRPSLILDLFELFKKDMSESKGHQKFRERMSQAI